MMVLRRRGGFLTWWCYGDMVSSYGGGVVEMWWVPNTVVLWRHGEFLRWWCCGDVVRSR